MDAKDHLTIAEKYLRQAEDVPTFGPAAVEHAERYTALASDHIEKARRLDPKAELVTGRTVSTIDDMIFDALRIQGHVEARHGEYRAEVRRGMTALRTALKYRPNSVTCHLSLAIGHERLKEEREFRQLLDKVIALDPTNQYAHELKDGAKGVDHARYAFWIEQVIEFFTMRQTYLIVAPCLFLLYCIFRTFHGIATGDPAAINYFWIWFLSSLAFFGIKWLRDRFAS